jgi:hypothetical protein
MDLSRPIYSLVALLVASKHQPKTNRVTLKIPELQAAASCKAVEFTNVRRLMESAWQAKQASTKKREFVPLKHDSAHCHRAQAKADVGQVASSSEVTASESTNPVVEIMLKGLASKRRTAGLDASPHTTDDEEEQRIGFKPKRYQSDPSFEDWKRSILE